MCAICSDVRRRQPLDAVQTEAALKKVAAAMKKGVKADHFEPLLNEILGTEMGDRDREVEQAWEVTHRRRRESE